MGPDRLRSRRRTLKCWTNSKTTCKSYTRVLQLDILVISEKVEVLRKDEKVHLHLTNEYESV